MPSDREREKWMADVEARQRNYVFPQTTKNETDGFRRLYESGRPLSTVQLVGFLAITILVCTCIFGWFRIGLVGWSELHGSWLTRIMRLVGGHLIALALFGMFTLLLGIGAKRAMAKAKRQKKRLHL